VCGQTAVGTETAEDQYNLHPIIMQIQLGCGAYYERRKISMARESCFLNKRIEIACHKEVFFSDVGSTYSNMIFNASEI